MLIPFMLQSWDWHSAGSIPASGEIVLLTPSGYDLMNGDKPFSYKIIRFADSKMNYIYRGYWTLDDQDYLDLFKSDVPFEFIP